MNQYIGNLIIRIVLGVTFFAHGLAKFQSGIDNVAGWFTSIGLPWPCIWRSNCRISWWYIINYRFRCTICRIVIRSYFSWSYRKGKWSSRFIRRWKESGI